MSNSSSGHFMVTLATNPCAERLGSLMFSVGINFLIFIVMVLVCNGLHYLLKPYSMPRIISDMFVGLIVGNLGFLRNTFEVFNKTFGFIIDFVMMFYMFALGIEMDPYKFFQRPSREVQIACAGIVSTFILACSLTPFFHYFSGPHMVEFTLALSILLSSTASPVLTSLITHLKIGKSDIGKLVIAAGMHSDFLCSLLLSLGYVGMPFPLFCDGSEVKVRIKKSIVMGVALLGQMVFAAFVSPIFMNWVNSENPEGRPMKGPYLVLSVAFMVLICASSTLYDYSSILSAFIAGICLPREGRLSKWIITRINYLLSTIFFPIFFLWMGYSADLSKFEWGQWGTWARLLMLIVIGMASKVAGTVASGAMLGFNWPDSVAVGLLLTTKGHFHIYLAIKVMKCGANSSTGIAMIIAIFCTVLHAPSVVAHIIRRARKRSPTHRMALQLLGPSTELGILLCLHSHQSVPSFLNFMEISRGTTDPGMVVYVTDMIELTDELAVYAEKLEGGDKSAVILNDKAIVGVRDKVTRSFQAYVEEDGDGITLKRTMAVSTFNNMARDICSMAEELTIALIILPFHRTQREDGTMDGGNPGFRHVNRKLLKSAPCSVGILVDRGLGSIKKISRSSVSINVALIFVGGKDDREAIAYAARVARHPGVKLTVLRFLVDSSSEASKFAGHSFGVNLSEQEEEMRLDDECFAQFYERHIVGGRISYVEKHLANSAETFSILKSFEGKYSLVIVGREGGVNSILTKGMNDWQQCPELGPIGDVLSGPDFSTTVSVLIIQQHKLKGEIDGLDDDFNIM